MTHLMPYSMSYQILRNPTSDPRDNLWGQFLAVREITSVLQQQSWAEPRQVGVCLRTRIGATWHAKM